MPWTEPFLKDSLAQMPPADRPFQSGVPILPQDPSFPRPPGENFMTPAEERRRREKEWSGEWNMDIDAVRSRLRNLK
ncbi:hypothetical protein BD626DRAFT_404225 [Schizophyllum amplum]|uniref:Uncharacterized protein n=1 Tax=Schizophyllum amplum TaxID=97359 RepID=A0A550CC47_9AGAR|nr:hypothetical protein BD626DRAFT_404225 [Auriculariopsis ampla]